MSGADRQRQALVKILGRGAPRQLRRLSRALGQNDAYLQQYLHRGSPLQLPEAVRHELAALLDVDEAVLRAEPAHQLATPRLVHVPLLEVEASTGSG